MANGNYTVLVDGQRFNVTVLEGNSDIQISPAPLQQIPQPVVTQQTTPVTKTEHTYNGTPVLAAVNGSVWKILVKEGDKVQKDQQIMILEAMKMEIDVVAPVSGTISKILVETTSSVEEGQTVAIIS